jgi:hypothetical protein
MPEFTVPIGNQFGGNGGKAVDVCRFFTHDFLVCRRANSPLRLFFKSRWAVVVVPARAVKSALVAFKPNPAQLATIEKAGPLS